jgi:hypothetical protein
MVGRTVRDVTSTANRKTKQRSKREIRLVKQFWVIGSTAVSGLGQRAVDEETDLASPVGIDSAV